MIKLHLGCGWRNFGKEWIHIDAGDYEHLDYKDIVNLPMADNTVDLIYASHVFEYFNKDEANRLLKEWKRVLKPSGILRLAVPDFESICGLYKMGTPLTSFIGPLYGKMKMGNQIIYHKMVYDFLTLKTVLEENGFEKVRRYDWRDTDHSSYDDHSQAYIPHMDKENGTLLSLNVEAYKNEI